MGCHFFIWGQTTVEVMKIMVTSFKRSHAYTATLTSPNSAAGHHQPMPPLETPGHSRASLDQSRGVSAPFSWFLVHTRFSLCPPRIYFPVLCKFWQQYGRVNGDLLQEGLCHTQVCCKPEPLSLWQSTADLYLPRRCSNKVLFHSLWGLSVLVHTQFV